VNPKFKKILIILVVFIAIVVIALVAYMSLSGMSNVTISDFKIVDANGQIMKDQYVYIGQNENDEIKIGLRISADGDAGGYNFYSTNTNVATVGWRNGGWHVDYFNSGKTTIVAQSKTIAALKDSFDVIVYENYATDLNFVSDGVQINNGKTIDVYADGKNYSYEFELSGFHDEYKQNSRLFEVTETSNPKLFKTCTVNSDNNTLELNVNRIVDDEIVKDSNEYIVIQSYIPDSKGNNVIKDNYIIKVNVLYNAVEDMQLIVSNNSSFSDDTTYVFSMLSDEDAALSNINKDNEILQRKIFFSKEIRTIYFKVRLVFSNGGVEYITSRTYYDQTSFSITGKVHDSATPAENYVRSLTLNTFASKYVYLNASLAAEYSPSRESISRKFIFIVLPDSAGNLGLGGAMDLDVSELYSLNEKVYTYSYFDSRLKRLDFVANNGGKIIGFTANTTGLKFVPHDVENGTYDNIISEYTETDTSTLGVSGE